jgi:hypothetical protein
MLNAAGFSSSFSSTMTRRSVDGWTFDFG